VSRTKDIGSWKLPRSGQEHPQRPHLAFRSPEALEKKKGAPNTLNTDENPAAVAQDCRASDVWPPGTKKDGTKR
jgi:hypothetical protein